MTKAVLIALLVLCFKSSNCQFKGDVVAISDGDTFTLLTSDQKQIKVRLHGIDCPESGQDFGSKAKIFLSSLIFSKKILIDDKGQDRYGRTIGVVYLDGLNINEEMLKNGMAWHYKKYDKNPEWSELENSARLDKKGLWIQEGALPPWEWRSNRKKVSN
jgi:micrococcal nuclease